MMKSEFIAALLGGGLSAITAAGFFMWEKTWSSKLHEKEHARVRSAQAFSVLTKLSMFYSSQLCFKKHLEKCYDEAQEDGMSGIDAADIVTMMIVPPVGNERLTAEELALCLLSKDRGLMEKLLNIQSNYLSTYYSIAMMNDLLKEYKEFKATNALMTSDISGDTGRLDMPPETKPQRDSMTADLNSLIGNLMEVLPKDIISNREGLRRFISAARSIDNLDVPEIKLSDDD